MEGKEFEKQCEEWLNPFGYSKLTHNSPGTSFIYTNIDEPYYPAIHCVHDNGNKTARIYYNGFKMFLSLNIEKIQFKHPNLESFLKVFKHYISLMENNPPF